MWLWRQGWQAVVEDWLWRHGWQVVLEGGCDYRAGDGGVEGVVVTTELDTGKGFGGIDLGRLWVWLIPKMHVPKRMEVKLTNCLATFSHPPPHTHTNSTTWDPLRCLAVVAPLLHDGPGLLLLCEPLLLSPTLHSFRHNYNHISFLVHSSRRSRVAVVDRCNGEGVAVAI